MLDPDRYIVQRNGRYQYKRRVPESVGILDDRYPMVRISLKTRDLLAARLKRDEFEDADNELWRRLLGGDDPDDSRTEYLKAVKRAEARGFAYKPAATLAAGDLEEIIRRIRAIDGAPTAVAEAVLGAVPVPATTVSDAFRIYMDEIVHDSTMGKSPNQKRHWRQVKQRAIDNFIKVVGDKPVSTITRDDAIKFYQFWLARVAPKCGKPTHAATSGNRDLGNMRQLYKAYFGYIGEERQNPFAGLTFSDAKDQTRPPFPTPWLVELLADASILAPLNDEARGILLVMIETGCRPSELCNIVHEQIHLSGNTPYLAIRPRKGDDAREIKTKSSIRDIPLLGVALAVMKAHPNGFPRYKDKEDSLSATIGKFLRVNNLLPSPKHSLYSIRHSFEDRMKEAGIDSELRRLLMGHTVDRPTYGSGGSLEWRAAELAKITLPFEPSVV